MRRQRGITMIIARRIALALLTLAVALTAALAFSISVLDLAGNEIPSFLGLLVAIATVCGVTGGLVVWMSTHVRGTRLHTRIALTIWIVLVAMIATVILSALAVVDSRTDVAYLATLLLFGAVVSGVVLSLVAAGIGDDVRALTGAAGQLASGDISARVSPRGGRELASLANGFNIMAEQIEQDLRLQRDHEIAWQGLLGAAAGDLRGPVSSLRVLADAAINNSGDPGEMRRLARAMERETLSLGRVIDDLAEIARLDAGPIPLRLESFPLGSVILDVAEHHRLEAQRLRVTLMLDVDRAGWPVLADSERLRRAFNAVLEHALRRTPVDGSVIVSVMDRGADLEIDVRDTGPESTLDLPRGFVGMGAGSLTRSAHAGNEGGLALLIARRLIEVNGGRIWTAPSPEGGQITAFTVPKTPPPAN